MTECLTIDSRRLEVLLQDPRTRIIDMRSSAAYAAGCDRMMDLLPEAGSDPGCCDHDGFTAFDMAATQTAYFLLRPKQPQTA